METSFHFTPEVPPQSSALHFEPGMHPQTTSERGAVYDRCYNGDLTATIWNKEVGERIASYAYHAPALLLSIDSLSPQPPTTTPLLNPLQEANFIWTHLPDRPNKLNHTAKVYVLNGDTDYYRLPNAVLPNVQEPASMQ